MKKCWCLAVTEVLEGEGLPCSVFAQFTAAETWCKGAGEAGE